MEQKNCLILDKEFIDYCKINNIEDVEKFAKETFKKGFNFLKYGESPRKKLDDVDRDLDIKNQKLSEETKKKLIESITDKVIIKEKRDLYDE